MTKKDDCYRPKATKRHAAIASNRRREEEQMKARLSEDKERNRCTIKTRREEIRKLPKEERAAAKEILRSEVEEMKSKEAADRQEYLAAVERRKRAERSMK